MPFKWFASLLIGAAILSSQPLSVQAQAHKGRILVLTSYGAKPFEEALSGFRDQLTKMGSTMQLEVVPLDGDGSKVTRMLEVGIQEGVELIFALGTVAARGVAGKTGDIPVLACVILDSRELTGQKNATGVVLDIPEETFLQSISRVLPGRKKIGILYDPGRSREKVEAASAAAAKMGFSLYAEKVEKVTEIPQALESLSRKVDVLWGIHDDTVYTPQTAKQILLFCYQNKIPFFGLSDAWVKAGALYSLDADYRDMGCQCAEMAGALLKGQKAGTMPIGRPRKLTRSVNLKTAQHMKLEIPAPVVQEATEVYK
jgi:putative ABC transport system substrate-binding protein